MKTTWIVMFIAALLVIGAVDRLPASSETEQISPLETLARNSGCFECHGPESEIRPSFLDIATRYKGDKSIRDTLIATIKLGGKGRWTEVSQGVPMPPYSNRLSDDEMAGLVDWMLSL